MDGIAIRIEHDTQNGQPAKCRLATFLKAGYGLELTLHQTTDRIKIASVTGQGIIIQYVSAYPLTIQTPVPVALLEKPDNERATFSESLMELRAHVLNAIERHERGPEHQGQPCWPERLNMIAFFCHALAIQPEQIPQVVEILASYEYDHHHR